MAALAIQRDRVKCFGLHSGSIYHLRLLLQACSVRQCHGGLLENLLFNALEYDLVMALPIPSQKEDSRIRLVQKNPPAIMMMMSWFLMAQDETDHGKELAMGNQPRDLYSHQQPERGRQMVLH